MLKTLSKTTRPSPLDHKSYPSEAQPTKLLLYIKICLGIRTRPTNHISLHHDKRARAKGFELLPLATQYRPIDHSKTTSYENTEQAYFIQNIDINLDMCME